MKILKSLGGRLLLGTSALLLVAATDNPQTASNAGADLGPDTALVKPAMGNLPANFQASPALQPIVTLAQSGVSETILMAYINNQGIRVALTAEEIVFLRDLGVSDEVIATLMLKPEGQATVLPSTVPTNATAAAGGPAATAGVPPAPAGVEPTPVAQPTEAVSTNQFVESLAPYGNWVEVSGYGLAWQPTVVVINSSWRPYADCGRWVWSNYGWYWDSDYSWGWGPFHYGRWISHPRLSWVWIPDTTWGASWVSWRYSPSYCGWAPLPPAACYRPSIGFSYYNRSVGINFEFGLGSSSYCFVPTQYFCSPRPRHHVVSHERNTAIYHSTTVVNNYHSENNQVVINRGIGRDAIARVAPTKVPEIEVRDGRGNGHSGVPGRIQRTEGGRAVVYRPSPNSIGTPTTLPALASASSTRQSQPSLNAASATSSSSSTERSRNLFRDEAGGRTPSGSRSLEPRTTVTMRPPTTAPSSLPPALPTVAENPDRPGVPARIGSGGGRPAPNRTPGSFTPAPLISAPQKPVASSQPTVRSLNTTSTRNTQSPVIAERPTSSSQPTARSLPSTVPSTAGITPRAPITTAPRTSVTTTPAPISPRPAPTTISPRPQTPVIGSPTQLPPMPQRYGATPSSSTTFNRPAPQPSAASRNQISINPSRPPNTYSVPNGVKPSVINSVPTGVKPSVINTVPTGVKPSVINTVPTGVRPSPTYSVPTGVKPSPTYSPPVGVPPSVGGAAAPSSRPGGSSFNRSQPGNRGGQ